MLHGHRITPPVSAVPEEGGASTASVGKARTERATSSPSQPGSARASSRPPSPASTPSSWRNTFAPAAVTARSTAWPASTRARTSASAYACPLAPVMPTK